MTRLLLGLFLLLGACASAPRLSARPASSVEILFKARAGETTETRYFSNAHILSYEGGQLLRDRTEAVDFTVQTHISKYDEKQGLIQSQVRTARKDGTVSLHDLAFPELHEQIDYVMRQNGEVLRAGLYDKGSLFYVPSMPIPQRRVEIGDTWTLDHTWLSAKDGIPLKLEIVAILKDIVSCEGSKTCADVEISGHVALVAMPTTEGARFDSRLWGRILFSVDRGDVLWSDMRSSESMGAPKERMDVTSCMVSELKTGEKFKTAMSCDPTVTPVDKVPQL